MIELPVCPVIPLVISGRARDGRWWHGPVSASRAAVEYRSPLISVGLLLQSGEALTNIVENLEGVINRASQRQQTFADVLATASLSCTGPADQVGLLHAGNGNHVFG